jgi:predicted dinucleotide-binding enzyme
MFSTIGIIGSGPVAQAVARHALKAGRRVVLSNSRGPGSLTELVAQLGDGAHAGTVQEAAAAELVVLAMPFTKVPDVAAEVADWSGHLVIDATNQFAESDPYDGRADIGELTGSEWVAQQLPGAVLVKAFNAMYSKYLAADPVHDEGRQVVFYAGNDADAKQQFAELVESFGFAGVDVGALREGGALLQLDGHLNALHVLRQS